MRTLLPTVIVSLTVTWLEILPMNYGANPPSVSGLIFGLRFAQARHIIIFEITFHRQQMKTLTTCQTLEQAQLVRTWLASGDVDSFIPDEITGTTLPHVAVYSGIRIQVADADFERASLLLKEYFASLPQPPLPVKRVTSKCHTKVKMTPFRPK